MHFSIPDTQEMKDESGPSYVAYNIHVNGVFHCAVRYKQLHSLHEQLKKLRSNLPSFPPKKLLPLSPAQVDERRLHLEKYIQLVSQDQAVSSNEVFNGFLLNAQQETQDQKAEEVDLEIFLMNGQKFKIRIMSTLQTDDVLETFAAEINLQAEFIYYFALYLIRKDTDGNIAVVRRMQDFESPYISLRASKGHHKIVARKCYWDSTYDDDLFEDQVALNLLYIQTVSDVERQWIIATKEMQRQLTVLQARGSKKEYLQLARTLKFYGYLQFLPSICDYPHPETRVVVNAGNRELVFRCQVEKGEIKEFSFKVTRMRCWRVTTSLNDNKTCPDGGAKLELAFQYLISKEKLLWVTIASEQAILLSVCLQGMVEELLMKKNGSRIRRPQDRIRKGSWSYMKRDGSSHHINVSRSPSADAIMEANVESKESSMKRLSEKLSSVSVKSSVRAISQKPLVENDAFEGIGDDDL